MRPLSEGCCVATDGETVQVIEYKLLTQIKIKYIFIIIFVVGINLNIGFI